MTEEATTEVLMPLMGEGITEATLVRWLKKPGESVRQEEPLLEVSTDKVDTEIPAPASGFVIATFANEGETVAVNSVIAHIAATATTAKAAPAAQGASDASPASPAAAKEAAGIARAAHSSPAGASAKALKDDDELSAAPLPRSSPLVRKIAQQHGINIQSLSGTGLHGRITRRDIEGYLAKGETSTRAPTSPGKAHNTPAATSDSKLKTLSQGKYETLDGVVVRREKMSRMRSLIAEHMVRSVRTSPHVTTVFEIDLHQVVSLRERFRKDYESRYGINLTYTHFFIHAATQAIKKHPIVNVSLDGDDILWKDSINIGCAVAIDNGLIVPVIRDAQGLNLLGIAKKLSDLVYRARNKKLLPEDVQGGTFSITNPGMMGSLHSAPIINQPQVAILSIGAIVKRPVVISDMIAIRPLVQIGLTFDHRIIDGEGGARYLASLRDILEGYSESEL